MEKQQEKMKRQGMRFKKKWNKIKKETDSRNK